MVDNAKDVECVEIVKCEPECVIDINNTNLTVDFALMWEIFWIFMDRDGIDESPVHEDHSPTSSDTSHSCRSTGSSSGRNTNPEEERQKRLAFFSRHSPV